MIWSKVCFMQTEKRLRYSISSFTLWIILRHQRRASGRYQIPCPTRTSSTEMWFRKILILLYKNPILFHWQRKGLGPFFCHLPGKQGFVNHHSPSTSQTQPTVEKPKEPFPWAVQESPVPNRNYNDLDLSWLCCPLGDFLQSHLAGAHSPPEFSPGTVTPQLQDCKHKLPYMGKVADTSSAGKCLHGY